MRRGAWHQCGANSQKVVRDFLSAGVGVGAILSPKDLAFENATMYSENYRAAGAGVLLDPQFYVPDYTAGRLSTYPITDFRRSIGALGQLSAIELSGLSTALENENRTLVTEAVIAPAIPYEAARADIVDLNGNLFRAAKAVGDAIGIPTYATVVLGASSTTPEVATNILSSATALEADGWYYAFEFGQERLPTDVDTVFRFCAAGLTLACTGKPVLHACAGPLSLLSFGAGARGAGIAFWQNLWGFERSRWQSSDRQGGGGGAPPRFFSSPLWGTVVYPDEVVQLTGPLRARVMVQSPFSTSTAGTQTLAWPKWESYRHLVQVMASVVQPLADLRNARQAMTTAIQLLQNATGLHNEIRNTGLILRDETASYQVPWTNAGARLLNDGSEDYEFLELLGGP